MPGRGEPHTGESCWSAAAPCRPGGAKKAAFPGRESCRKLMMLSHFIIEKERAAAPENNAAEQRESSGVFHSLRPFGGKPGGPPKKTGAKKEAAFQLPLFQKREDLFEKGVINLWAE